MRWSVLLLAMMALCSCAYGSSVAILKRALTEQVGSGKLVSSVSSVSSGGAAAHGIPVSAPHASIPGESGSPLPPPPGLGHEPADKSGTPSGSHPPPPPNDAQAEANAKAIGRAAGSKAAIIDSLNKKHESELVKKGLIPASSSSILHSSSSLLPQNAPIPSQKECDANPKKCLYKVKEVEHLHEDLKALVKSAKKHEEEEEEHEHHEESSHHHESSSHGSHHSSSLSHSSGHHSSHHSGHHSDSGHHSSHSASGYSAPLTSTTASGRVSSVSSIGPTRSSTVPVRFAQTQ